MPDSDGVYMPLTESAGYEYKSYACRAAKELGYAYVLWREPCKACGGNAFYVSSFTCTRCDLVKRSQRYRNNREAEIKYGNERKRKLRVSKFRASILEIAKKSGMLVYTGDACIDAANEQRVIDFSYELLGTYRSSQVISAYVNVRVDTRGLLDD